MSTMTHCDKVLAVLADGKGHSTSDLYRRAGNMILHSRIADLRRRGHDIVCERVKGLKGPEAYVYTWVDAPPKPTPIRLHMTSVRITKLDTSPAPAAAPVQMVLGSDEIAPRTERERYRLYRVRNGGEPEIVATVSSPEAVGVALCTLGAEGEFEDTCLGVLDALDRFDNGKWIGKWIVKPWQAR